ncbi:MAG: hypothetical protein H0U34_09205 [Sphingomonas sp.]|nr:hypothetical protein [Sphingomonas sp.]
MEEQIHAPTAAELPSKRQLNRATLLAAAVASVLLITTVLPAEYGYDPTGAGRVLGLTAMGEMKRDEAATAEADADATAAGDTGDLTLDEPPAPSAAPVGAGNGEVTLTLAPNEGTEVKATMKAGEELEYEWSTGGPRVNFELHGEEIGAPSSEYTSYEKGTSAGESGTFRAPFDGTHGWFWRNRTGSPLTITIKATGAFEKFEQQQ